MSLGKDLNVDSVPRKGPYDFTDSEGVAGMAHAMRDAFPVLMLESDEAIRKAMESAVEDYVLWSSEGSD